MFALWSLFQVDWLDGAFKILDEIKLTVLFSAKDHVWFNTTKEVVYPPSIPQPILFCYEPRRPTKTLFKTWTSVKVFYNTNDNIICNIQLLIDCLKHVFIFQFFVSDNKDFIIYSGDNESHIHTQYEQTSKSWFQLFPYWTQRVVFLSPFSRSCVGVVSSSKLVANLVVQGNRLIFE